ncbi:7tm 6 domain containing protein, partial [Asbolus verrucosus]
MEGKKPFDWKWAVRSNFSVMTVAGLWPSGDETYKLDFYTIYASVLITLLLCHVFFQIVYFVSVLDDLQALTATGVVLLSEIMIVLKAHCLTKNMGMVKQLMITLNSDLFQPKTIQQIILVKPSLKFAGNSNEFVDWIYFLQFFSSKLIYAIFECDWIRMSQQTKRAMIFFTLKCQKPLKVSAFNLFYLSLETFV